MYASIHLGKDVVGGVYSYVPKLYCVGGQVECGLRGFLLFFNFSLFVKPFHVSCSDSLMLIWYFHFGTLVGTAMLIQTFKLNSLG